MSPANENNASAGLFQSWAREQVTPHMAEPSRAGALRPVLPYAFDSGPPNEDLTFEGEEVVLGPPENAQHAPSTAVAYTRTGSSDGVHTEGGDVRSLDAPDTESPEVQTTSRDVDPALPRVVTAAAPAHSPSRTGYTEPARVASRRTESGTILPPPASVAVRADRAPAPPSVASARGSREREMSSMLRPRMAASPLGPLPPVVPAPEPTIEIHIGRIEVRAAAPAKAAAPTPTPPSTSDRRLENYLRRRSQGARS